MATYTDAEILAALLRGQRAMLIISDRIQSKFLNFYSKDYKTLKFIQYDIHILYHTLLSEYEFTPYDSDYYSLVNVLISKCQEVDSFNSDYDTINLSYQNISVPTTIVYEPLLPYATTTGSNIDLTAFRLALAINNVNNTTDLLKPISTATQTALDLKQSLSAKNQANGYAGLDSGALLPLSLFPDSVLGNLKYGGTYNGTVISASDDFPELNGQNLPTSGYVGVYFIATAQFTRASVTYDVGDWIVHNGSNNYVKVDNSDAVTTVFGRLGNVVANEADYSAFYLPITNPTFTGTITGGNSVLSGSATVGTYIYGASSKRLAYTAGANLNILYSGGAGGLTINNQADNLALVNVSDAGVLTVHPLAGSGERSLVATSTGAIAISAAPFITAAQNYYIGTTQNALNRASGAQTLTGISIDGNSATTTLAANSTNWNGSIGNLATEATSPATTASLAVYDATVSAWRFQTVNNFKTTLGLGSNAYTSTAYLPLTAGSGSPLSGDLYLNGSDRVLYLGNGVGNNYSAIKGVDGGLIFYTGTGAYNNRYAIDASGNNTWTGSGTFGGTIQGTRLGINIAPQSNVRTYVYDNSADLSFGVQQDGAGDIASFRGNGAAVRVSIAESGALTGTSATFAGSTSGGVLVSSSASAVTIPTTGLSLKTGFSVGYLSNYVSGSFAPIFYGASEHNFNAPIVGTSATFVGNVQISGATNAQKTFYLDNYPNTATHDFLSVSQGLKIQAKQPTTGNILLNPDGGNVGIGTTSPDYKLDVEGDTRFGSTAGNSVVRILANTTGLSRIIAEDGSDAGYIDYDHATDSWIIRTAGTTALTIASNQAITAASTFTAADDIETTGTAKGIILKDTGDSSRRRITVNNGVLVVSAAL